RRAAHLHGPRRLHRPVTLRHTRFPAAIRFPAGLGNAWRAPDVRRYWRRRRAERRVPLRWTVFLMTASGILGWWVGRMHAVPERPPILLQVYRHDLGRVVTMDLEDYVKGVIAAEMPTTFHIEALKAQAVAARTLALNLLNQGRPLPDHPEAIISTDHRTHQAWRSPESAREEWGLSFYWRWAKITRAVSETRGLVMVYGDEIIYPAYHASSGGRTEDSENYWPSHVPYLRSVDDPYSANDRYQRTETVVSKAHLAEAVAGLAGRDALAVRGGGAAGAANLTVQVLSRFPSGRVERVRVGEAVVTGRQLREALGLRSNWFDVEDLGDAVRFVVRGYGHGIGMSQYGADAMARAGFGFDQILTHYYTGVEIVSFYE